MTVKERFERAVEAVAEEIAANPPQPIDTGFFERMHTTGSLGIPIWLHHLLVDAGVQHVRMVELGENGRGVLTEAGWVSIAELREVVESKR